VHQEGYYDIRHGAAGYSPIIGTFGALAVPAIILVFPLVNEKPPVQHNLIVLSAGLLIVTLIGSITGAIGLSAIGAERDLTANLVPSAMYLAVTVSVSLVAMLGAFAVLADVYLQGFAILFVAITGIAGLTGIFFTALSVADSWNTGPSGLSTKSYWQNSQWIKSQRHAERQAVAVICVNSVPAIAGILLAVSGVNVHLDSAGVSLIVVSTLALTMLGTGMGAMRTRHSTPQKGLRWYEAYGTAAIISLYTIIMMIFLPR
jgi:hypothetical protein